MAKTNGISIEIKLDNSDKVLAVVKAAADRALMACGEKCADYAATPIAEGGNCPVDSGRLRDSIDAQPQEPGVVRVGTPLKYAMAQEVGSHGRAGHFFITKACTEHVAEYKALIEESFKNA